MKKQFAMGISLLLIVGLISMVFLYAQDNKVEKKEAVQKIERGRNFVDKDNDGICDNNKHGFGRGIGKMGMRQSRNFIDKDNDGICDNFPQGNNGNRGKGIGPNFVDKNNDGICDNRPANIGNRKGMGKRSGNCDGTHKGWRGSK